MLDAPESLKKRIDSYRDNIGPSLPGSVMPDYVVIDPLDLNRQNQLGVYHVVNNYYMIYEDNNVVIYSRAQPSKRIASL